MSLPASTRSAAAANDVVNIPLPFNTLLIVVSANVGSVAAPPEPVAAAEIV
jgi:hypothetical protein